MSPSSVLAALAVATLLPLACTHAPDASNLPMSPPSLTTPVQSGDPERGATVSRLDDLTSLVVERVTVTGGLVPTLTIELHNPLGVLITNLKIVIIDNPPSRSLPVPVSAPLVLRPGASLTLVVPLVGPRTTTVQAWGLVAPLPTG
ncbi:MAG: hypothetical protein ABI743_08755 [bacterium]